MHYICQYNLYTGCEACVQVCPVQCISMKKESDGFKYSTINKNQCIIR